jgi:hypothetical protein
VNRWSLALSLLQAISKRKGIKYRIFLMQLLSEL